MPKRREDKEKSARNLIYAKKYRQRRCKFCGHRSSRLGRCKGCGGEMKS